MKKISAACAMEWSIDLEKGLRSTNPSRVMEAILNIGPRLEQWNREPGLTMIEYNLFGLISGEDKLFGNTILLRLADAFQSGDKHTRLCVVRGFVSVMRHHGMKSCQDNGILAKHRIDNQKELLKRIKTVLFTGDIESRAFALILFGCWADFAIDSAEIRHLILSNLVSCHDLEVRAALFTAGCFCKLSDDFAYAVLEILVKIISSKSLSTVRLAGARVFAKLGRSYALTNKVYKTGAKLVMESLEEDLLVAMLISLSKLASTSTLLMSEQVDMILSFLTQDTTLHIKAISLKCLNFLFRKGLCFFPSAELSFITLSSLLDKPELPLPLQFEALQLLHKIILYNLPGLPCLDVLKLTKLFAIVEDASQYPNMSIRLLAIHTLITVSEKYRGVMEVELDGDTTISLPSRIISLIIDRIIFLAKFELEIHGTEAEMEQESQSLLKLLVLLVNQHPNLGVPMMNKVLILIEYLVNMCEKVIDTREHGSSIQLIEDFKGKKTTYIFSKILFCIYKFLLACLENLGEIGEITTEILLKVKFLVECVHRCSLFDYYTRTIYSLLLNYLTSFHWLIKENKDTYLFYGQAGKYIKDYLAEQENSSLECANQMLARSNNWPAYKAARYAVCQGIWSTAAFIFGKLMTNVEPGSFSHWFKFLAQFAQCEMEFKLYVSNKSYGLLVWLQANETCTLPSSDKVGEIGKCSEKFVGIYGTLYSLSEILGNSWDQAFCFQRWLVALRANVLENVSGMLKLLGTLQFNMNQTGSDRVVDYLTSSPHISSLMYQLSETSLKLKSLSEEFDLIAMSFININRKSLEIISSYALSCSMLSFCAGFTSFLPHLTAYNHSHAILAQNLIQRLWHVDPETIITLRLLMKVIGQPKRCFHLPCRNQVLSVSCETSHILGVCRYAVKGFVDLQNQMNKVDKEEIIISQITNGFKLLLDIIEKWMRIPFQIPMYFFHVRPCVGSELFAVDNDSKKTDGIFVLPGFDLSLDLCLQIKNMPPNILARQTKLYCILHYKKSFQTEESHVKNQRKEDFQSWESDCIIDLNKKLLHYVFGCAAQTNMKCTGNNACGGDMDCYEFVGFKLNGKGQGFSTCLLNVSDFSPGSYIIKWHGCCVDNDGCYWSLLPLNYGPVFTVHKSIEN